MSPVAELVGQWIVKVDGEIVASGATMQEAVENAISEGPHEDFIVEKVAEPGGYVL